VVLAQGECPGGLFKSLYKKKGAKMNDAIKTKVLSSLAGAETWYPSGKSKVQVGSATIHVRFCSTNHRSPSKYKFNINPNTLSADYELWICGDVGTYYLIPIDVIKQIYSDPNTYPDYHHDEIKVVSVDSHGNYVTYATGGKSINIQPFLRGKIHQ
jgi:hypothetical protein